MGIVGHLEKVLAHAEALREDLKTWKMDVSWLQGWRDEEYMWADGQQAQAEKVKKLAAELQSEMPRLSDVRQVAMDTTNKSGLEEARSEYDHKLDRAFFESFKRWYCLNIKWEYHGWASDVLYNI